MASPSTKPSTPLARANKAANNNQNGTAVGKTKQACPVFDVIVMVAGTVDPVNSSNSKLANSFNKYDGASHDPRFKTESAEDTDYYWSGNPEFVGAIIDFQTTYDHVHAFRDHSWSGDNCVDNRKLAGQILGDWLCGNAMEPALPAWLKRKVSFHFIGHSHGGNVINEVTRRIAKISKWPADWKVKSVVYLSTPFFQTIHFPMTTKFHGKARILNAFCQYDLTQTAIADFSLRQLTAITDTVEGSKARIVPMFDRIVNFDMSSLDALKVMPGARRTGTAWYDPRFETYWEMDPTKGRNLYDRVLALLKDIKDIFAEVKGAIIELNKEIEIRTSEVFQDRLQDRRKIINDAMKNRIIAELDKVLGLLTPIDRSFKARVASGVYPVRGFISDLHITNFAGSLIAGLVAFLNVNPANLNGNVTSLLYDAFKEQIEVFDDTLATCDHIYKGFPPIVPVDVTPHDVYYKKRDPQFYRFKARLIAAEVAYMGGPNQYRFLHMLFLLAAQLEEIRRYLPKGDEIVGYLDTFISWWNVVDDSSSFITGVQNIRDLLFNWLLVFKTRECGGIEWNGIDRKPKYGSVPYLAVEAHSTSRQKMYQEYDTFLRAQFDSHEVKAKR